MLSERVPNQSELGRRSGNICDAGGGGALQSSGQSTADDYEMFLKMKAAALQNKGMLSERVPNQSTELGRRSGNICDVGGGVVG